MIITESAASADLVADAVQALVEAASRSPVEFTVSQLQEMVELEAQLLGEAGGLISVIKRVYSGTDMNVVNQIEREIPSIKTKVGKAKTIAFLNRLIDEAGKSEEGGAYGHFRDAVKGGDIGLVLRWVRRNGGHIGKYKAALEKIKAKVEAIKTEDE